MSECEPIREDPTAFALLVLLHECGQNVWPPRKPAAERKLRTSGRTADRCPIEALLQTSVTELLQYQAVRDWQFCESWQFGIAGIPAVGVRRLDVL